VDRIIWGKFDEILGFKIDDVWEKIAARKRKVLKDEVKGIIGIFNTRNGNVSNLEMQNDKKEESGTSFRRMHTFSIKVGKMTLLISSHNSGLNLRPPSLSYKRSLVRRAQSSPNC